MISCWTPTAAQSSRCRGAGGLWFVHSLLQAMEEDIEKRSRARKARVKEANDLKDEGNRAFKEGRYQNAAELYGASISVTPWLTSAYTNRALVYLKLKNFKGAVDDCKEALAVAEYNNEKSDADIILKAMKRKAEGYEGLGKFDKAVRELEAALVLKGDNKELHAALQATQQRWDQSKAQAELRVKLESDEAIQDLVSVKDALLQLDQGAGKLADNLAVLAKQLAHGEARSLFRELEGTRVVLKAIGSGEDLLVLSVLAAACLNSFNIADLLGCKGALAVVMDVALSSEKPLQLRSAAVELLALVSDENDESVRIMCKQSRIADCMRTLLTVPEVQRNTLVVIRNLSSNKGFRSAARGLGLLELLAQKISPTSSQQDLEDVTGAMSLLINDDKTREQVTESMVLRSVELLSAQNTLPATALNTLGFLLNACVDELPRTILSKQSPALLLKKHMKDLSSPLARRVLGLGARVAQSGDCAMEFVQNGYVELVIPATLAECGEEMQSASIRFLAVLVTKTESAIAALKKANFFRTASVLLTLENQAFVGNLCMLVSRVATAQDNLELFKDYVQPLVTIMHKTDGATQKNAAIACAKLARHPAYLQQIRDLHGIEIMFHYVKP
eukprot:TRINITY_DN4870_c0_g2_i8.p1 TRINITY_DN4870_c0_g2~~TRINITY_DN4870_c0_g2_i8.p1  ORF type:complete len:619 (-),score=179.27 TRINITY_DN4870_c0_g2_i8:613-2469(-)